MQFTIYHMLNSRRRTSLMVCVKAINFSHRRHFDDVHAYPLALIGSNQNEIGFYFEIVL